MFVWQIYIFSFLISVFLSYVLYRKYDLNKNQLLIYLLLIFFWSAVVIIRAYRKSYALSLGMDMSEAAVIASAYGLSSMLFRFLIYYISDIWHSRKKLLFIGLSFLIITNIFTILSPSYFSLYINSFSMGVAASMLSFFNIIFAGTFSEKEAMKSISILSLAPLISEFAMSAFQGLYTQKNMENYNFLWYISIPFAILALCLLFFVEDKKSSEKNISLSSLFPALKQIKVYIYGMAAIFLALVKFATSGSNLITYFQSDLIAMNSFLVAYSDFIFSLAQLFGGLLAGLILNKYLNLGELLLLGFALMTFYNILLLFSANNYLLFFASVFPGFGYGLAYNALIGLALVSVKLKDRELSMALFQSFFAVGIFYADKIFKYFRYSAEQATYFRVYLFTLIISIIALVILSIYSFFIRNKLVKTT